MEEKSDQTEKKLGDDDVGLLGGAFRGIAASLRSSLPAIKSSVRAVGTARPLAFASEGGVAAQSMIPKYLYYGAWGLSGAAVLADIATKTMDAPEDMVWQTAGYHTAFHIPASIVLPAVIIHKIVHQTEHAVTTNTSLAKLSSKTKRLIPVAVAIASIGVVVPVVDHACEWAMEPTLGSALGLKFSHHHHDEHEEEKKKGE